MGSMTAVPRGREFTRDDLDAMPDDGNRYELIDGVLVVTPGPAPRHQGVLMELAYCLRTACPPHLRVRPAPLDVALAERTVVQPDLLVARPADFTARDLTGPPLLVVEILSPTTAVHDQHTKKAAYARAGCPSYWIVDPDGPTITEFRLVGNAYEVASQASGSESFTTAEPFEVSFRPVDLLD